MWLPASFALVGTVVAGAATWLGLTAQPVVQQQSQVEVANGRAAMTSVAPADGSAPRPPDTRKPDAESITMGDTQARSASAPSGSATDAPANTDHSSQDIKQPVDGSIRQPGKGEDCPPLVAIPFKRDSAKPVITDVKPALDDLIEFLNRHPEAKLSVEGHADAVGPDNYNLLLSYWRAKAVISLLTGSGIAEERMTLSAAGKYAPVEGLPRDAGENRRAVLQVRGAESCQTVTALGVRK